MTVINKNNGKKYEVFDVTYDNAGYPHFLVYKDNQWVRMRAKHFRTFTEADLVKELMDYDKTTLSFSEYNC